MLCLHCLCPVLPCGVLLYHGFNVHVLSPNNPHRNSADNKTEFVPLIISKIVYGKKKGKICLSASSSNYFLCQYAMLQAVPNKHAGFIVIRTSIFMLLDFLRSLSPSFYFMIFTSGSFQSLLNIYILFGYVGNVL